MRVELELMDGTLSVRWGGRELLRHRPEEPCCFVGRSGDHMEMHHRNAHADELEVRSPLRIAKVSGDKTRPVLSFLRFEGDIPHLIIAIVARRHGVHFEFIHAPSGVNRLWWRVPAHVDEAVWGCGEQMTHFNLRGHRIQLRSSESISGDHFRTGYPQPTYLSSNRYCLHAETTAYAEFDFRHPQFHQLHFWALPERLEFMFGSSFVSLVTAISNRFGRQPPLPAWLRKGVILGLEGGESHARMVVGLAREGGLAIAGLWCEDWRNPRAASSGKTPLWDCRWNRELYPMLNHWGRELSESGIRLLGCVSPFLSSDDALYAEALQNGFLATAPDGGDYLADFEGSSCGIVDLTNADAACWFESRVLRNGLLDSGLSGWIADLGGGLPLDLKLANGVDARLMRNAWRTLWAEVNARALASAGKSGDAIFFMRNGFTEGPAHCPLAPTGDRTVDFSRFVGMQTAICGALSTGLLGNAYHHSDIGGNASQYGSVRSRELFQRWAEMAVFSAMMRRHESDSPNDNFRFYQDDKVLRHFARMTALHVALEPYIRELVDEASSFGLPLQRPLFLHYEDDRLTYVIQNQFLFGRDLLVTPVHDADQDEWTAYLPKGDDWVHLWSGQHLRGGQWASVPAPLGQPPVFVRRGCAREKFFTGLAAALVL